MASAEVGLSVGVSGSVGLYEAAGSETEGTETNKTGNNEMLGGMGSIFIEQRLSFLPGPLSRLSIGYDKVLHEIKTGSADNTRGRGDLGACAINTCTVASPAVTIANAQNSASATIDNLNTMYVSVNLTDWFFVKYGTMEADVKSTEHLQTGSVYGDTSMDGTMYSAGLHFKTDSGIFTRFEVEEKEFDGFSLTSTTNSDNKVTLDGIDGTSYRVSIGKTF
jgi:hypothetical protein